MAMLQVRTVCNLTNNFSHFSYGAYQKVYHKHVNALHVTSIRRYPSAPALPLPTNVSEIFANETGRFTPERSRDITASVFLYGSNSASSVFPQQAKQSFNQTNFSTCDDTHVESYDCFGAVSLNGTMQSNVPKPFCSGGKSTHLNMPGGQWARDGKYIAEHMQKSHYRIMNHRTTKLNKNGTGITNILFQTIYRPTHISSTNYSTGKPPNDPLIAKKQEYVRQNIRKFAFAFTIIYAIITLISFSGSYIVVISGVNVKPLIENLYQNNRKRVDEILTTYSQLKIAYTIHQSFAFFRVGFAMIATPLLLRHLRKISSLKIPKPS